MKAAETQGFLNLAPFRATTAAALFRKAHLALMNSREYAQREGASETGGGDGKNFDR
jgi:hypothetical protein